jgi:hypothetical protein
VRRLDVLRSNIAALERYCYRPDRVAQRPGFGSSRSYTGPQELSPDPHNRQAAIHKLVETCLEVAHELRAPDTGLNIPEPPRMPVELCEIPATDGRHWLAFKEVVGRLGVWADTCRQALTHADQRLALQLEGAGQPAHIEQASPQAEGTRANGTVTPPEQTSPVARAIALMWDHHQRHKKLMPVAGLLKLIPDTSKASLYRDPGFRAARAAIKSALRGNLPSGYRGDDGRVEAEDE